nr:ATP-dependent RNA helicase HrpA [Alteromonas sediminis]
MAAFIERNIALCMLKDRFPLLRQVQVAKRQKAMPFEKAMSWFARFEKSVSNRKIRSVNVPECEYPALPVSDRKEDIVQAIKANQVVIIAGETGSGKTTQLPKMCLEAGLGQAGMIAHTQPRRLAARSVANRIAEELNTPLGEKVGFKIRFSDQVSENSYIKLMTDGMLLAEMQQDRFLNGYDTIIIDEAHERSLNIDFLLGYLKQLLPKRPDLKVIITSATIDPERFSKHFFGAPIIEVSGRTYPVEIRYRDPAGADVELEQVDAITAAVDELQSEGKGDILVFLSGERDIRDTQEALLKRQYRHTEIVPLFARLSAAEQNRVFQPHSGRRIILATNVAETSLTVPGIKYVIDTGVARISRYSPRTKVQRLPIEAISQASANQRAGRCGRVSEGICIRLYSEDDYLGRPEFTDPEILRTNLASVILQMTALGLGDISRFPFVESPDNRNITDGFRLLDELQAITSVKGKPKLTEIGRKLSRLPVDPRYARMVLAANEVNAVREVLIIAAGLSIQDPRERPQDKRQLADEKHAEFIDKHSDFVTLLNVWQAFSENQQKLSNNQLRKWCKQHFIHYLRMREWQDIVSQIKKSLSEVNVGLNTAAADGDSVHKAILTGLLSHIGMKDKDNQFLGARNSHFHIFPGSALSKKPPKWLMSAELVETSRLFARLNAKIEPEWIEPRAKHLTKSSYSEPHWSKKRGAVMAYEKVTLFGVPIVAKRLVTYSSIEPALCRELFIREALVNQDNKLRISVLDENASLIAEAEDVEQKTRRRDWLVDEDALYDFYAERIPDHVLSEPSFKKWWGKVSDKSVLQFTHEDVFKQRPSQQVANAFPETWQQGRLSLRLRYQFEPNATDDGVTCQIPLPLLNQVSPQGFDWLIPGLQQEKVIALIKSLPKKLRRNFVPAPNYADAALSDIEQFDKNGAPTTLLDALSTKLFRMTGVKVEKEDWQVELLPSHLHMHFEVVDEDGKALAFDNDLVELQRKMQGHVKETFEQAVTPELERKGLVSWDFEQLPTRFTQQHGGFEVQAFPALVSKGNQVDIELLTTEEKAEKAHQQGVATLLKLAMPSPLRYLQEKLPNKAKLGLYFNPFGEVKALIDDCIMAGIIHLMHEFAAQYDASLRDQRQFVECEKFVRGRINEQVLDIAKTVEKGLTLAHTIQKQLKGKVPLQLIQAMGHIKTHMDSLVYPGFVSEMGTHKLQDWLRYVKALEKRVEKAKVDPQRDKLNQMSIDKVEAAYSKTLQTYHQSVAPASLYDTQWMIEELRVSLFAQQLGTAYPISAKRILSHLTQF